MMRRSSPKKEIGSSLTDDIVARLRKLGSKSVRDGMLRYGIPNENAFGVSVGKIQKLSKELGRNHELALASSIRE